MTFDATIGAYAQIADDLGKGIMLADLGIAAGMPLGYQLRDAIFRVLDAQEPTANPPLGTVLGEAFGGLRAAVVSAAKRAWAGAKAALSGAWKAASGAPWLAIGFAGVYAAAHILKPDAAVQIAEVAGLQSLQREQLNRLPPAEAAALAAKMEPSYGSGIFDSIGKVLPWLAVGAGVLLVWPLLRRARRASEAA